MLSNEQFRSLVYQKADEENSRLKKKRTLIMRGVAAFSVCIIIGGVFIHGQFGSNDASSESEQITDEEIMLENFVRGADGTNVFYSASDDFAENEMVKPESVAALYDVGAADDQAFVSAFSYSEDIKSIKKSDEIYKDTFEEQGSYALTLHEIVVIAKEKCTVEYDTVDVYFDDTAEMWKVVFSLSGVAGGCQTVYIDNNGTVELIVYGE